MRVLSTVGHEEMSGQTRGRSASQRGSESKSFLDPDSARTRCRKRLCLLILVLNMSGGEATAIQHSIIAQVSITHGNGSLVSFGFLLFALACRR